jgi:hypothetical protein
MNSILFETDAYLQGDQSWFETVSHRGTRQARAQPAETGKTRQGRPTVSVHEKVILYSLFHAHAYMMWPAVRYL